MKLIHKFILVYLLISLFVFTVGGVISFYTFSKVNDSETDSELWGQAHQLYKLIEKNVSLEALSEDGEINIKVLRDTVNLQRSTHFSDTTAYHRASKGMVPYRKIKYIRNINGIWHNIEIHNSLLEPDDTIYGVFVSSSLIYLLLVSITLILSFFISKWLLDPFNISLKKIESFSIKDKKALVFPKTRTKEFDQFNEFIQKMTEKAIGDYNNLREFSENIAHEIRTPLAVSSGKLELLLQTKSLSNHEVKLISEAQMALKKISKIQHSLGILSKIQNEEFNMEKSVDLSQSISNALEDHADIIALRKIKVSKEINPEIKLTNDPIIIEILVTNLLQNAIKHNIQANGFIDIKLTSNEFSITNSGNEIASSPSNLIQRFKRNGQAGDSLGLGLSIVNDICTKSNYQLKYDYDGDTKKHKIFVCF